MQVVIGKWGHSLAVRLPASIAEATRLHDGDTVSVEARNGDVVISRVDRGAILAELFRGRSAEEWRAAYADAWDWGPDVGREIIRE